MENWELYEDRVKSLLDRWSKFVKQHPDRVRSAIAACTSEINDDFTKQLIENDPPYRPNLSKLDIELLDRRNVL